MGFWITLNGFIVSPAFADDLGSNTMESKPDLKKAKAGGLSSKTKVCSLHFVYNQFYEVSSCGLLMCYR